MITTYHHLTTVLVHRIATADTGKGKPAAGRIPDAVAAAVADGADVVVGDGGYQKPDERSH